MLLEKKDLYSKAVFLPFSKGYVVLSMLHSFEKKRNGFLVCSVCGYGLCGERAGGKKKVLFQNHG